MIWTDCIYQLVEDIDKNVRNGVMESSNIDCVIKTIDEYVTWQELKEIVKFFQDNGFEATWYHNSNHVPVIMVTWGVPQDIDDINNRFATDIKMLKAYGNSVKKFEQILTQYLSYVYYASRKDACVIPIKHLYYICGKDSTFLNYNIFNNVIDKLSTQDNLKVQLCTFDENEWDIDYISIQKIK